MAGRPKGYAAWSPTPEVAEVVAQVQGVLREYSGYGPMTVRQIFYRLVGQHNYPKDERAYKRLAEYLVKARRAKMIRFGSIRDDGTTVHSGRQNSDRGDVWEYMESIISTPASYLHLDRNGGQPCHIELWCEAAGMAPMLAQMVRHRDVSVYSTGGFSSVTVTYEVGQRVAERDKPTHFLHVGDYDPSGESIFTSMSQDIGAFVAATIGGYIYTSTGRAETKDEVPFFIPQRVALTEEQVAEFDLPTAPAKASDTRSRTWDGLATTQAEAMPPDLLERVVLEAIGELTDNDVLEELEAREESDKERLRAAVEDMSVEDAMAEHGLENPSLLELVSAIARGDAQA